MNKWDVRYANFDIPLSRGRSEILVDMEYCGHCDKSSQYNLSQLASDDRLIWVKEPKPPAEVLEWHRWDEGGR